MITVDSDNPNEPVDMDVYFIVTDKCTECKGFHEEPQFKLKKTPNLLKNTTTILKLHLIL